MTKPAIRTVHIGVALCVFTVAVTLALFSKDRITTVFMAGETVTVQFDRAYKLRPYISEVKVGYVPVGKVTAVERQPDGSAEVKLKVDEDALDRLGSAPSATIRPTTLLGGIYFVDLAPGGDPGRFSAREIPVERTEVPVELDRVARSLQPDALRGAQATLRRMDAFLDRGGDAALRRLVQDAPGTLAPAARVLDAAQGEQPERDLTRVVDGLESTARVLSEEDGQLESILAGLDATAATLASQAPAISATLAELPAALDSTRVGLASLDGSLVELRAVAGDTRSVAQELDTTLTQLEPTLAEARPMVRDLRLVLADARPLVHNLVPTAQTSHRMFLDVRGPVLDRLDRSMVPFLSSEYDGEGSYRMTHSDEPMYLEAALALGNVARATAMVDRNGHGVSFQPGPGTGSVGGLPVSLEQMFEVMQGWMSLPQPLETVPPLSGPGGRQNLDAFVGELIGGAR